MGSSPTQLEECVAYFVSPHGFGHAARTCAVIEAVHRIAPSIHFHIYTTAPEWFFRDSLGNYWTYHACLSDVGMVQKTALQEDVEATLNQLRDFIPFQDQRIQRLAEELHSLNVNLVLCDISPLGLQVAERAGLPSVLIENFTWAWIYAGYESSTEKFSPFIDYLRDCFAVANYHIRTAPFCERTPADLVTAPVSRAPRHRRCETRRRLGIQGDQRAVLITMGGIPDNWDFSVLRANYPEIFFVIPAGASKKLRVANIIYLPHHHSYFHPDLVASCDAVIGKVGYSTIAEVYWAGNPFGYISRRDFRESVPLVDFIRDNIQGFEILQEEFEGGDWHRRIGDLVKLDRLERSGENGAGQIANYLASTKLINGN